MNINGQEKERIAARARPLHDRLAIPATGDDEPVDDDTDWLAEWRDRVADGDEEVFARRLDLSDLSIEECRRRLDRRGWPDEPLPAWIDRLDDVLGFVEANAPDVSTYDPIGADEVPFAHVLAVLVEYASDRVDWAAAPEPVSEAAVTAFERQLVERLSALSAHPLFIEFKTFVATRDRELAFADDPPMPASPRRYYDEFTETMFEGGLKSFFEEYAVLARLFVTFIDQWIAAVEEFCSRLAADWSALQEAFGPRRTLGPITDVEFLGDAHQGGKRVFGVTFESGTKLAYKPRTIEIEAAFYELLGWINDNADFPTLRTLDCLSRDGYGWMEWAEAEECTSSDGVARYYRRAGVLVCLLYALNFTDGHLENIIAAGDQPAIVDLETVAQPAPAREKIGVESEVTGIIRDSVLRTHVLPMNVLESDLPNIGGLGAPKAKTSGVELPEFENVNTDVMELEYRDTHTIEGKSLPHLDGQPVTADDHYDALAAGFERAYRFLLAYREPILAEGGPLEPFEHTEIRFLFRSTRIYGRTLRPLKTPSYLRTGLTFGCKVETLANSFATGTIDPELWPMYEAERTALWRFDVPRFTMKTDDTDLLHDDRAIENAIETPPFEQVRRRIASLDEADLREQLDYLTLAYASEKLSNPRPPSSPAGGPPPATRDVFERTAREIFERIRENAVRTPDGDLTWHIREHRNDRIYFHRVPDHLYYGRVGIALFGAALATAFDEEVYREFTADVTAPVMAELDEADPFPDMPLGGASGLGSLVYGFDAIGDLLDDDRYRHAAERSASLLSADRFESDEVYDVLGGSAGAIFGLLALYDRTGDEDALNRAVLAGEHLLANRVETAGTRAWLTISENHPLTGFSHGVAGIACALVRLADVTGEARFRDAGLESLEYERQHFSAERRNWRDLREDATQDFMTGWCAGPAGIGLARLEMGETVSEPTFHEELDHALHATDPEMLIDRDHLCCGNFGRVAFLRRAGRVLGDETYHDQARRLANRVVHRAGAADRFTVPWQTDHWYNPSLFFGEAGIGYELLRFDQPELPCVVLWK